MVRFFSQHLLRIAIIGLFLITIIRWIGLYLAPFPIMPDEALYWLYGQLEDWGYYSKPPLLPWLLQFSTNLWDDKSSWGLRFFIPLLHTSIAIILALTSWQLRHCLKTALTTGLIYSLLPAVQFSSNLASTDPLLMLGWSLALYGFICLVTHKTKWISCFLITTGLFIGLMTKYTMAFWIIGAILYSIVQRPKRDIWLSLGLSLLTAMLLMTPHWLWMFNHQFITLQHVIDNTNSQNYGLHWHKGLEFILAQFGIFGIINGILLSTALLSILKAKASRTQNYLLPFIWPALLLMIIQAFLVRANANWAAPCYLAGSVLLADWCIHGKAKRQYYLNLSHYLNATIMIALLIGNAILYHWHHALPSVLDPARRFRATEPVIEQINQQAVKTNTKLLLNDRKWTALLLYYVPALEKNLYFWQPPTQPARNHFAMTMALPSYPNQEKFLYVVWGHYQPPQANPAILQRFDTTEKLPPIMHHTFPDRQTSAQSWIVQGFTGYAD